MTDQVRIRRIPNFPNYLLTPDGNVYSLKREAWIKPSVVGTPRMRSEGRAVYQYALRGINGLGERVVRHITTTRLILLTYGPVEGYSHKQHQPPPLPSFIPTYKYLREILTIVDDDLQITNGG